MLQDFNCKYLSSRHLTYTHNNNNKHGYNTATYSSHSHFYLLLIVLNHPFPFSKTLFACSLLYVSQYPGLEKEEGPRGWGNQRGGGGGGGGKVTN